jgi:CRISPR system Cascade subunit CasA
MDLIGDPWIPVQYDGEQRATLVGLKRLFADSERIRDLVATPPQRVALMRLLLCIAQAALDGPADEPDWRACRDRLVPASLGYLASRHDRFQLYGERPFLQVPSLTPTANAALDKLEFGLAAGNNHTFFDHGAGPAGRPQSPAWAALNLLTFQCFSPGGLIGDNAWGGVATGRSSEHAPGIEGSPLHLLILAKRLVDSLHLNLITKAQLAVSPTATWGQPVWDQDFRGPADAVAAAQRASYLGRLVPLPRAILLQPGATTFTLANGLRYDKVPLYREPSTTLILRGKGPQERLAYLNINLDKHPWRELGALLALDANAHSTGGALPLRHLATLAGNRREVELWTGGLVADRGKLIDVAEWRFTIPLDFLRENSLLKYQDGVALANRGAAVLSRAVQEYCQELKLANPLATPARAYYWACLNAVSDQLIRIANDDSSPLGGDWYRIVVAAMHQGCEHACPRLNPRQIQAYAKAQQLLRLKPPTN